MKRKNRKYNYFYKITNNINNHFYYGVHSTDNLDDGYMGSGTRLGYAIRKYGIENFKKEIIKFFDTYNEAYEYEAEIVTEELTKNSNCYNIQQGGKGFHTNGLATVMDSSGNCFDVSVNDPRYLSGELVGITKGWGIYKNTKTNKLEKAHYLDERIKSGELVGSSTNMVLMKDKNNKTYFINKNDPNFENIINEKQLVFFFKDRITVKDKKENYYSVLNDDPRYISGKLIPIWSGLKHSEQTKKQMSETHKRNKDQQGEKNSQYGTCWVYKNDNNKIINQKINKNELNVYLSNGWIKGRKMDNTFSNKVKQGMKQK